MSKRDETATVQFKLRMREGLRAKLEAAAAEHDMSLSAEAVARIEQSFEVDLLKEIQGLPGGRSTFAMLTIVGRAMHEAGTAARRFTSDGSDPAAIANWPQNPYAFDQAMRAAIAILEALRPPGDASAPRVGTPSGIGIDLNQVIASLGEHTARTTLAAVENPDSAPSRGLQDFGRSVRVLLSGDGTDDGR